MKKRAIVSLATERGNYYQALARLADSLKDNFSGDFLGFMGEAAVGAEKHLDNPYSFKLNAIEQAFRMGYTSIMWLDSSVYAIKKIDHLFDLIESKGYLMQDSGNSIGEWCNDKGLEEFGVSRDEAMRMLMYGNAGMLGLDFTNKTARSFLRKWGICKSLGLFKGEWNNDNNTESQDIRCKGHRHEMAIGSLIAHSLYMNYQPGNQILQYAAPEDTPINDTICLFAQGI